MSPNVIHPTAAIDASVKIGSDVTVGPYTVIRGDVTIGNGTWIGPHVSIGLPAQFSNKKFELFRELQQGITIGERVVIREYVSVHQPSEHLTVIEDDSYLMAYSHVSHDTRIRRGAILANSVQIGGFSDIGERSNIGLGTVIHQFTTVGALTMVGMGSVITKDVPPFRKAFGNPLRVHGINIVGLQRAGYNVDSIREIDAWYRNGRALQSSTLLQVVRAYAERRTSTGRPEAPQNLLEPYNPDGE